MLQSLTLLLLFESCLRKHHCLCTVPLKCDHSPKKSHLERACPPCKISLLCYCHCHVDFSSPAAGEWFFFLVSCFKQVKAEVPPSNGPREMSWGLLGDGEEIGKKESWGFEFWKEKIVHKLIEMSQDFMDLHNDRPTRNRNISVLVCRGSAHPAFCIFPISATSPLKLQCQGKQMLTPCTNWHYKVRIGPTLLQAKKLFPMPLPKTWRILNQA